MKKIQNHLKRGTALALAAVMAAGLALPQSSLAAPKQDELYLGSASTTFKSKKARALFQEGAESLPAKFDLRDVNGKNYVTQVKFQNPWSACWSFAACAASEESLLYENGVSNEEFKKINNNKEFDLSEKALAFFSYQKLTPADVSPDAVPASQVGEGADVSELEETDRNAAYSNGGMIFFATSLFSSGSGPKSEDQEVDGEKPYAYCGKNKYTEYDEYTKPELKEEALKLLRKEIQAAYPELTDEAIEAAAQKYYEIKATEVKEKLANGETFSYSAADDWTIPVDYKHRTETNAAILQESHILPSPAKRDVSGNYLGFDQTGVDAIKSELHEGRAVSIAYHADQSKPGQEISDDASINVEGANPTWAQYTYDENAGANHGVTIVGYDDNYSSDNFLSGKNKAGLDRNPHKNGAFIVKNSWGSVNDESEGGHNKHEWGINGSGYFYLSYYDKSIVAVESYNYYTSNDEDNPTYDEWYVNQYDFMPASEVVSDIYNVKTSMANVFTAEFDQKLTHISAQSATPGTECIYEIYRLNDGFKNPRDGELLDSDTVKFDFGGYHRIPVSKKVAIAKGTTFSVVLTNKVLDENNKTGYETVGFCAGGKQTGFSGDEYTIKGVVNKGESFVCTDGQWEDYADQIENVIKPESSAVGITEFDNFAIKAYSVPATKAEVSTDLSKAKVTLKKSAATYNGKVQKPSVKSVTLNGKTVPSSGYTVSILNAKGTAKASPKNAGSYVVKITGNTSKNYKGSAKAAYKINQAANTIKVGGKTITKAVAFNVKQTAVKKKAKTYKITRNGKGKISISKKSSVKLNKYIALSGTNVVLRKGAPKGKYKFTVTVAANTNWKKTTSKVVTIVVQ